ncbi:GIN domain-containing protein [Hymenobacter sp. HD11105]
MRSWFVMLVLTPWLAGCAKDHEGDCFKSTGSIVTERRVLPPFQDLATYTNVDVTLVQEEGLTEPYAEVRAGKNLQEDIELKVENGRLTVRNTSRCNWVRRYNTPREVTLHIPTIRDVALLGAGNIRTAGNFRTGTVFFHLVGAGDYDLDMTSETMYLDMYELGDVRLRGAAEELSLIVGGLGTLRASELQTQRCFFELTRNSDGSAYVQATDVVGGLHAGTGTLYYSGTSNTDIKLTGKGKVVKLD